jgi:hypothetical protein
MTWPETTPKFSDFLRLGRCCVSWCQSDAVENSNGHVRNESTNSANRQTSSLRKHFCKPKLETDRSVSFQFLSVLIGNFHKKVNGEPPCVVHFRIGRFSRVGGFAPKGGLMRDPLRLDHQPIKNDRSARLREEEPIRPVFSI